MFVRTARGGRVEMRGLNGAQADFSQTSAIPSPGETGLSSSGEPVNLALAMGLPAAYHAIRMRSNLVALPRIGVFERAGDNDRRPAADSWQYKLFNERPAATLTAFDVRFAIEASLAGYANAYLLKAKSGGEVREHYPLNPAQVRVKPPKNYGGEPTYVITAPGAAPVELGRSEILHIKGFSFDGIVGISPVTLARNALGAALAQEKFGAKYFDNDATPGGVLQAPEGAGNSKREGVKEAWKAAHEGTTNKFKTAILPAGWEFKAIGMSLADAQFIDGQNASVRTCARIFDMPAWLLEDPESALQQANEDAMIRLSQIYLSSSWARTASAIVADPDYFPPDSDLYPEHNSAALTAANLASRYGAYLKGRQAGWMTANEIRARENMPPIEGGDELQLTPVGGAPNDPVSDSQKIADLEDQING